MSYSGVTQASCELIAKAIAFRLTSCLTQRNVCLEALHTNAPSSLDRAHPHHTDIILSTDLNFSAMTVCSLTAAVTVLGQALVCAQAFANHSDWWNGSFGRALSDNLPQLGQPYQLTRPAAFCTADHATRLYCRSDWMTSIAASTTAYTRTNTGVWTLAGDTNKCIEQGKVCRYKSYEYVSTFHQTSTTRLIAPPCIQDAYCVSQAEIDAAPADDRYLDNIVVADAMRSVGRV